MIVKKEVIDLLKNFETGEIEEFPITLINHRDRVHSKDYLVLNPLGTKDYLNKELSEIDYSEKIGNIIWISKYILDREKLKEASDLFSNLPVKTFAFRRMNEPFLEIALL